MRTTLDIADDVLFAAKDFARRDRKTLGQVISEWGRAALQNPAAVQKTAEGKARQGQNKFLATKTSGFTILDSGLCLTARE